MCVCVRVCVCVRMAQVERVEGDVPVERGGCTFLTLGRKVCGC